MRYWPCTLNYSKILQIMSDSSGKKRNLKSLGTGTSRWAKSTRDSAKQAVSSDTGQKVKAVSGATVKSAQDVATRIGQGAGGVASQSKKSVKEGVYS